MCVVSKSCSTSGIATVFSLAVLLLAAFLPSTTVAQLQLGPRPGELGSGELGSESKSLVPGADGVKEKVSPVQNFRKMLLAIKTGEAEVNRLYSAMPIGFPEKQKAYMIQIKVLEAKVATLNAGLSDAALASFNSAPMEDQAALQFVLQHMGQMLDPTEPQSSFNPSGALEILDLLLKNGAEENGGILYAGFRSCFAIEDFDKARTMLERIEATNPKADLSEIYSYLDEASEKWQRELMIRRLEKNNDNLPVVKFETTAGDFEVVLYEDHAPNAVANMISLVEKKFYDDLTFHYVKPGEYVHTGCPNGDGTGGPGYAIASEFDSPEARYFFSGTLGMANTGPNTEGSQFVITHQPISQLDGRFTAFGRVVEGFEVALKMKAVSPASILPDAPPQPDPIKIIRATVISKRDHEYEPTRVTMTEDGEDSTDRFTGGTPSGSVFDQTSAQTPTSDIPSVDGGLFTPTQP